MIKRRHLVGDAKGLVAHANGEPTKGELAKHGEMFIGLDGVTF